MPVIDPCHRCGKTVYHDGSEHFPHNILCADCKTDDEKQREHYESLLKVAHQNLQHVRENEGDCGDPDCEIHSPWVCEDEAHRINAIAMWIAGAKAASSDIEDTLHGALEEKLQSIADEGMAPDVP